MKTLVFNYDNREIHIGDEGKQDYTLCGYKIYPDFYKQIDSRNLTNAQWRELCPDCSKRFTKNVLNEN